MENTLPPEQGFRARSVRTLGFARREIVGIFRQPRLIVTLIVAPFLILVLFGLGYRTQPPAFATLLVLPSEEAGLAAEDEFLGDAFGDAIDLVGTTTDATEARSRLRTGDVDLLIIAPGDAVSSLEEGESARFLVVHSEVDPVIRASISLLARLSVEELNRLVLSEVVAEAQTEAAALQGPLDALRAGSGRLIGAIEAGDAELEQSAREDLETSIDEIEDETASSNRLISNVSEALGTENSDVFDELRGLLDATSSDPDRALENAEEFDARVDELGTRLDQLQAIDADLLVSPFSAGVEDIADLPGEPALFYAPGVLVILVQHLAITFAALSVVRERQLGLTELFKASPLGATEILIGKFAAFVVIAGTVAAALTGAMFAFGVTMRGSFLDYSLYVGLVIFASIGLGFVLSALAQTDSQAVQYTMILLLVSIFFTGMVLPLAQIIPPVRTVSYLIPGTYGIEALHDVMFRGLRPSLLITGGLALYGVLLLIASWFVLRRHVREST